jgi:hypothetical protein
VKNVTDYRIVEGSSPSSLSGKVQELLKHGWQPFSSPVACVNANGNKAIIQAMVKYGHVNSG